MNSLMEIWFHSLLQYSILEGIFQSSNSNSIQNKNVDFIMPGFARQNIANLHKNKNWVNNIFHFLFRQQYFCAIFGALKSLASLLSIMRGLKKAGDEQNDEKTLLHLMVQQLQSTLCKFWPNSHMPVA